MKPRLSLLVLSLLGGIAYACSSPSKEPTGDPAAGATGEPGEPGTPGAPTSEELAKNPIEGLAPAKAVVEIGTFTDGPVWHAQLGVVFFTTPLGEGAVYRMLPDGRVMQLREGVRALGTTPIGNTVAANGDLVTVDAKRIVRTAVAGEPGAQPVPIATGGPSGPDAGPGLFDTLNDVVTLKDGTIFATDPGYFAEPTANRIIRVPPDGTVQIVEAFEDVPRPNGIALAEDEKTVFVGFTAPTAGTLPFVRQYNVNADGTLGEWTKFVDIVPEDSAPDGLALDKAGNLFVATKAGIEVFAKDSSKIGVIAIPEVPTGMTFGGADLKTLYVTTQGIKIWELRMNIQGLAQ